MSLGRIVLAVYAVLMLVGGVMGYRAAHSAASLVAGAASAVVLLVALFLSFGAPAAGYWLGSLTSLALCVVFALRLAKTGKFMPSGMLLAVSFVALVLVSYAALGAQGKLKV
jgi:uncharacterized membrane protein (UPF0136 family)